MLRMFLDVFRMYFRIYNTALQFTICSVMTGLSMSFGFYGAFMGKFMDGWVMVRG